MQIKIQSGKRSELHKITIVAGNETFIIREDGMLWWKTYRVMRKKGDGAGELFICSKLSLMHGELLQGWMGRKRRHVFKSLHPITSIKHD